MRRASFHYTVQTDLRLSRGEHAALIECARHHYDRAVRALIERGGLLHQLAMPGYEHVDTLAVQVSTAELGLLVKCMEQPPATAMFAAERSSLVAVLPRLLAEAIAEGYRDSGGLSEQLADVIAQLETALQNAKQARGTVDRAAEDGRTVPVATVREHLEHTVGNANLATSEVSRLLAEYTLAPVTVVRQPSPDGQDQGV